MSIWLQTDLWFSRQPAAGLQRRRFVRKKGFGKWKEFGQRNAWVWSEEEV